MLAFVAAKPISHVYVRNDHFKFAPWFQLPHFEGSHRCFQVAVTLAGQGHSHVLGRTGGPTHTHGSTALHRAHGAASPELPH